MERGLPKQEGDANSSRRTRTAERCGCGCGSQQQRREDGGVVVGLLTTSSAFSGNTCLAARIQTYLFPPEAPRQRCSCGGITGTTQHSQGQRRRGGFVADCRLLSHTDFASSREFEAYCNQNGIHTVLGVHAYRSGRLLFGRTGLNPDRCRPCLLHQLCVAMTQIG